MFEKNLLLISCFFMVLLIQTHGIWNETLTNDFIKNPKIINGTEASLNATRHQVSIRIRSIDSISFGAGHICGGSLISENVVLSAAHCFVDDNGTFLPEEHFIVVIGNLDRFEHNNNTLIFDIKKIVKHAKVFNVTSLANDIVLLMLNGTVQAKHSTVMPIILNDGPLEKNTICQSTGWGLTEDEKLADKLRTVDLAIVHLNDCRAQIVEGPTLIEGMICAGYSEGERDTCSGDSGGPLVCRGLQAGIVSWGIGCALPSSPGVYTDVTYFKDWILQKVTLHNGTLPQFSSANIIDGDDNGATTFNRAVFLICFMLILNFLCVQLR